MDLADVFNILHNAVESQYMGKKISQKEMAKKVGVSMRTYQDWKIGNSAPQAPRDVLHMLAELGHEDIVRVVHKINQLKDAHCAASANIIDSVCTMSFCPGASTKVSKTT